jgi:proline iminopeptidase
MTATLFPDLPTRRQGFFQLDELHTMYWEESGNPAGIPVVVLHGGPGGGSSPLWRRFFNPEHYRIVQFDQRGCGKSTPLNELRDNTTPHLIADMELLRQFLGIDKWLLFGGSWGATLALAYGQHYPQRCLGFILRSIFTFSKNEIDWFLYGGKYFHPDLWAEFASFIPPAERGNLLLAYHKRLNAGEDCDIRIAAAAAWTQYELRRSSLMGTLSDCPAEFALTLASLECHYMLHDGFIPANSLIQNISRIAHLPCAIIQGRYDVLCPPHTAALVAAHWPGSRLTVVPAAGHTAFEPGMLAELLNAAVVFHSDGAFSK